MRAEIIAIGDELTTGQRLDTNSQWLAERLLEIGVPVAFHTTVGDTLADNVLVFRQACERAEIVVASGGLGPTADDLTRHALAELAGVPLVQDDASLERIKQLFRYRKREMPPANAIQAMFPEGSVPISNVHGTAPGISMTILRAGRAPSLVFAVPGVPAEMKWMWTASIAPTLLSTLGVKRQIGHFRIKCFGVGESDLEAMLPNLIARDRYPLVGITVHEATITLRITAQGESKEAAIRAMRPTIGEIENCLGDLIFGYEDEELEDVVIRLLKEKGKTLAVGESGVTGLLSHWLAKSNQETGVDGVFLGSVVVIRAWIAPTIDQFENGLRSALAEDSVIATNFARDVQARFSADVGLAIWADSPDQPNATVYLAVVSDNGSTTQKLPLAAHPEVLYPRAAKQALNLLRLHLLGKA